MTPYGFASTTEPDLPSTPPRALILHVLQGLFWVDLEIPPLGRLKSAPLHLGDGKTLW